MKGPLPWQLLADVVLSLHVAIVGNLRAWCWVNAVWFRLAHLAAIAVVVAGAWLGAVCPLTNLEMWLRGQARSPTYAESFIEHWLQRILYYDAPVWIFTLGYSLFGLIVVATWWYFPPRWGRPMNEPHA